METCLCSHLCIGLTIVNSVCLLITPLIFLSKIYPLLAPSVKITSYKFLLSLVYSSVVWKGTETCSIIFLKWSQFLRWFCIFSSEKMKKRNSLSLVCTIYKQWQNSDKMKVSSKNWKFGKHDKNRSTHYLLFVNSFHTNYLHENTLWVWKFLRVCLKVGTDM